MSKIFFYRVIVTILCLGTIFFQIASVIIPNISAFIQPYYTEEIYKSLEDTFNRSQYRIKNPTAIIPDETVYSYAAGAYLHGVDPIIVNSERTPLGKYFLSLSIYLFRNDRLPILIFAVVTMIALWLLGSVVLHDNVLALIPVVLLSLEKLFLDQLRYVPLLDIIHLPFVLLAMYLFLREDSKRRFFWTALILGFVIATKTVYTGILLVVVFILYYALHNMVYKIFRLLAYLPLTAMVLLLSYVKTFQNGYNVIDFIGFQKWILLYDTSKLIYPFSIWQLIFFNKWQTWWGDFRILHADDWNITWPIFTLLTIVAIILSVSKKIDKKDPIKILLLWFVVYSSYMSLGIASSRFLLLSLPVEFIVGIYVLRYITVYGCKRK